MTTLPTLPAEVGDHVIVSHGQGGKAGWVRFYGFVDFAPGPWVGIEFEKALGKHDGFKEGKRYFSCKKQHGSFVRPDKVRKLRASKAPTAHKPASGTSFR